MKIVGYHNFLRITRLVTLVIHPDYQTFCLRSTPVYYRLDSWSREQYISYSLPKCRLLCDVDYTIAPYFLFFSCSLWLVIPGCLSGQLSRYFGHWGLLSFLLLCTISCSCDVLCLIRCPRYCNFLVLNCLAISLLVLILLNTSSLVIFSVHHIFDNPHLKGFTCGHQ